MKKNAYWIIITILELAALISSIVLSTYTAFVFNFTTDILLQIGESIESLPLVNMKDASLEPESNESKIIFDIWRGTVEGCNCIGIELPESTCKNKICRRECRQGETKGGCTKIDPIAPIKITNWKGKEFLSTVLDSSYNYSSLLSHSVKKGEECKEGYKKCGILDTMNNVMCLKEEQTCPINLLFVTDMASLPTEYSNYTFKRVSFDDGKVLHFTNQAVDQKIVTDFRISDEQVCINSDEYNSPYSSYVLDYYQYYGCKTKFSNIQYNTNYNKLDSIDKYNLYDKNHILTKLMQLPKYPIEELTQQNTNLYMNNYIGFDKEYFSKISFDLHKAIDYSKDIKTASNLNIAVFGMEVCGVLFYMVLNIWMYAPEHEKESTIVNKRIVYVLYNLIISILSVLSLIVFKGFEFRGKNFSDDVSMAILESIQKGLDKSCVFIIVIIVNSLIPLVGVVLSGIINKVGDAFCPGIGTEKIYKKKNADTFISSVSSDGIIEYNIK